MRCVSEVIRRVLGWAERVLLGLATFALILMMFVISFDALGRYI